MKPSTEQDYHERIVRTLAYIQRHLDDELELENLAAVAAFSRFHFHRVFRGLVGESLQEHICRLRLERAAQRLKQGDGPIIGIALEAGFETHESFTRAFGTMFGVPPSGYRAAHKPAPESASGTHLDDVSGYHPPNYEAPLAVEFEEQPSMKLVFLRHVGPYSQVGATWGRLMNWAGMRGLLGPQTRTIGIVYDDPDITPADKIRYAAAVVVNRPVQPEGEFGVTEIPAGKHAVFTHRGPYDGLGRTYQRFFGGWLPSSGSELRDAEAFEEYLNSPMNTKPEDLLTRIHVPVRD
jgi:AraC family transcriptional regulator